MSDMIARAIASKNASSLAEKAQQSDIGVSLEVSFPRQSGETDDSARIQRAVNSLTSGGELILQPYKTYSVLTSITNLDNITIVGNSATIQGDGTKTIFNAGNNNRFVNLNFKNVDCAIKGMNTSKLYIEKCSFDTISTVALYLYGVNDSVISFCYFNNVTKNGIIIDNNAYNIEIVGNHMTNPSQYGGYATSQTTAYINCMNGADVRVIGNRIKNNGGQGITFGNNSVSNLGSTYCRAIGNYCEGNGQEGITCFGGSPHLSYGHIVEGNTCRNNRYHQIEIWQADKCTVIGNLVEENSTTGNIAAITFYGTSLSKAIGNTVLNAQNNGISVLYGSDKCIIENNIIRETNLSNNASSIAGHGVIHDNNGGTFPTNITISNNMIESTNANVGSKSGVYSSNNTNNGNFINNNRVFGYKVDVHYFAKQTTYNYLSSAPTSGKWSLGQTAINVLPSAGSPVGWDTITQGVANNTPWAATTAYTVGQQVNSNGYVYQCTVAGTSASTAPSFTSGTGTDGTVTWSYVDTLAAFKPYGTLVSSKTGTTTYNGDGTTTTKSIPHSLGATPSYYQVTPASAAAGTAGIKYVSVDATNINVTFNAAPSSGTNNVSLTWKAEV